MTLARQFFSSASVVESYVHSPCSSVLQGAAAKNKAGEWRETKNFTVSIKVADHKLELADELPVHS